MAKFVVSFFFSAFTLFAFFIASSVAEEFAVGGEDGWRQPAANEAEIYVRWAAALRFRVGDSLRFRYKNDTVVAVDKWGYYHCNSSHAAAVFKNGNTVIDLKQPGTVYFISADPNHCKNGQRVMVDVMDLNLAGGTRPEDESPAPSPNCSDFVDPQLMFCYVVFLVASINNM
ncbi:early nodulin-like protein 7 [Striga hermonthica]|uniref:Early nodulin-like protein 7 n=1 Tax=Striga hermonthica TaxID=68872 RepID=A0A9N7RMQ1_STRHE|nr:early nodulin-like protein 7 [Striga hermonthica]